jgi:hypothetical protein
MTKELENKSIEKGKSMKSKFLERFREEYWLLSPDPFYYNGHALPDRVTIIE